MTKIFRFRPQVIRHKGYYANASGSDNDIALLKLAEPIVFPSNNKIAPVCLPRPGELYENVVATVTGWGNTTWRKRLKNIL